MASIWRLACRSHNEGNEPSNGRWEGKEEVRGRDVATTESVLGHLNPLLLHHSLSCNGGIGPINESWNHFWHTFIDDGPKSLWCVIPNFFLIDMLVSFIRELLVM